MVFRVEEAYFGLETSYVRAITKNITWTDNGAVEYKGQKICVVDFLEKRAEKCREADFVVVSCKGRECVIPVDEVMDIFQVVEKDIVPIPSFAAKAMSRNFYSGVFLLNNIMILLLDVGKL